MDKLSFFIISIHVDRKIILHAENLSEAKIFMHYYLTSPSQICLFRWETAKLLVLSLFVNSVIMPKWKKIANSDQGLIPALRVGCPLRTPKKLYGTMYHFSNILLLGLSRYMLGNNDFPQNSVRPVCAKKLLGH